MRRWNAKEGMLKENVKVDAFLDDIWKVCQQHGMSIGHEDGHGAFIIQPLDENNRQWLLHATDETDV